MAKSDKLPALHFYVGDWKKDAAVQSLSLIDRAVWLEMLFLMHCSSERGVLLLNDKPPTDAQLARLIGTETKTITESITNLDELGICSRRSDGAIFSRRMVEDERKRQIFAKNGLNGGRPSKNNQNDNQTKTKSKTKISENVNQNTENENEYEYIDNNKKNSLTDTSITIPEKINTPEVQKAVSMWAEKLRSQGRYLDQITLDSQLMRLSFDIKRILAAITYSCSLTKCRNLIEPPDNYVPQKNKTQTPTAKLVEKKLPWETEQKEISTPESRAEVQRAREALKNLKSRGHVDIPIKTIE